MSNYHYLCRWSDWHRWKWSTMTGIWSCRAPKSASRIDRLPIWHEYETGTNRKSMKNEQDLILVWIWHDMDRWFITFDLNRQDFETGMISAPRQRLRAYLACFINVTVVGIGDFGREGGLLSFGQCGFNLTLWQSDSGTLNGIMVCWCAHMNGASLTGIWEELGEIAGEAKSKNWSFGFWERDKPDIMAVNTRSFVVLWVLLNYVGSLKIGHHLTEIEIETLGLSWLVRIDRSDGGAVLMTDDDI